VREPRSGQSVVISSVMLKAEAGPQGDGGCSVHHNRLGLRRLDRLRRGSALRMRSDGRTDGHDQWQESSPNWTAAARPKSRCGWCDRGSSHFCM